MAIASIVARFATLVTIVVINRTKEAAMKKALATMKLKVLVEAANTGAIICRMEAICVCAIEATSLIPTIRKSALTWMNAKLSEIIVRKFAPTITELMLVHAEKASSSMTISAEFAEPYGVETPRSSSAPGPTFTDRSLSPPTTAGSSPS